MFIHILTHYSFIIWTGIFIFASNSWAGGLWGTQKDSTVEKTQIIAWATVSLLSQQGTSSDDTLVRGVT